LQVFFEFNLTNVRREHQKQGAKYGKEFHEVAGPIPKEQRTD
jgi:hypothetical protein